MKSLIIIESPFQLLSAVQYCSEYNIKNAHCIFIETKEVENNLQVELLLNELKVYDFFDVFISFEFSIIKRGKTDFYFIANILRNVLNVRRLRLHTLVVGDIRSKYIRLYIHNVDYFKLTLVDDGVALINSIVQLDSISDHFILFKSNFLYFLNTIIYPLIGKKDVFIFSIIPVETLKLVSNTLAGDNYSENYFDGHFFTEYSNLKLTQSSDHYDLVIIGGAVVEASIIPESVYVDKLVSSVNKMDLGPGSKILYVRHRRELSEKVDNIKRSIDCDVYSFEIPIELVFLQNLITAKTIITVTSAALFTLHKMNVNSNYYYIYIEPDILSKDNRLSFQRLYGLFSTFAKEIR